MFDVFEIEGLSTDQSQNTSGGTDNNVWAVLLQNFLVLFNWHTTEEDGNLKISGKICEKLNLFSKYLHGIHVFWESLVLFWNLEGQFTSVAHDDDGHISINGLQLLKGSQDENGSFTHT